jgi:hypothetical protein
MTSAALVHPTRLPDSRPDLDEPQFDILPYANVCAPYLEVTYRTLKHVIRQASLVPRCAEPLNTLLQFSPGR